ncbi:MAG: M13 family metallopeptidase [Deltaproteobacteria bacterium]|nr:M13 family metallopeptidase [Deltaproteobacteria bacterium]
MRHLTTPLILSLSLLLACPGQTPPPETPVAEAAPEVSALGQSILAAIDPQADACQDFYAYACGGWLATAEIPPDKPEVSRGFSAVFDRNEEVLHEILDNAAADPGDDADLAMVGAFYGACMDTEAIDARGLEPLAPFLEEIAAIEDTEALMATVGRLQVISVETLFGAAVEPDYKSPDTNLFMVMQGGLGLPDREYYLNDEAAEIRAAYEQHVANMFLLLGDNDEDAAAHAATVVRFETALAEVSLPLVELRDPVTTYHKLDLDGLQGLTPHLPWKALLEATGYPDLTSINVATPGFFEGLDALVAETPMEDVHTYLQWWLISESTGALGAAVQAETFDFYGKTLSGAQEDRPRWKKCVQWTDDYLGDVLAQLYVEQMFAGDSKEIAVEMIQRVEGALQAGMADLEWMDDTTRERAVAKLGVILNKIGYPDKWRDYAGLEVTTDDHFGNLMAGRAFETRYWLDQAEQPVDETIWYMTAPTVNAYYNPLANEIVFPAGIMQPPFFDRTFPKALNYGAMGLVMGHEVTHGFDDEGRKFDAEGRLAEWWEPEVAERFEERAECVRELYSGYEVLPGVNLDGDLTAGENIADLGGIKHAFGAYRGWVADNSAEEVAGLDGEKLFFVGYAQSWCTLRTPELERMRAATDPHSSPKFRVNGAVSQFPAFGEVFGCEVGSPMRPETACEVW